MFKCDCCQDSSKEGEKQNKVYLFRNKLYKNSTVEFDPKTRKKVRVEFESRGDEIKEELNYCRKCIGE